MKYTLAFFSMLFVMNVYASNPQPTEAEIRKNRSCFQDLEIQGCRTQEEDPEQFRTCLADAQDSLDDYCQNMLKKLYGE